MHKRALVWLRRDLRSFDHRAWSEAELHSDELAVVFVFDTNILKKLESDDRRLSFIYDSLRELKEILESKGSTLIIRHGDPVIEIPKLVKALKADALFLNRDYEKYARQRDRKVKAEVESAGVHFYDFKDHVIFEADEVKTLAGEAFKVFTPYSNAWAKKLEPEMLKEAKVSLKNLLPKSEVEKHSRNLSLSDLNFEEQELFVMPGRKAGLKQFEEFKKKLSHYKVNRDFPAIKGSSLLSVHLRFGTLSIREVFRGTSSKDQGTLTWHKELVWREFYQMLLTSFPQVPEKCFQPKYDDIEWPGNKRDFALWCEGNTGYPLIDAAMRHFAKTGWMHNRLRMIVASFLTKDLLCHWKWGEKFFAQHLLDFELASNNGGWQWAASVGCDAQPYFRIFNPVLQSERFDPKGIFIRENLPELSKIPDKFIHAPWTADKALLKSWGVELGNNYPFPIVNHAEQKVKAVRIFKN